MDNLKDIIAKNFKGIGLNLITSYYYPGLLQLLRKTTAI